MQPMGTRAASFQLEDEKLNRASKRPMVVVDIKEGPAGRAVPIREEEKLKGLFRGCDKNGDGVLDKNELREAFRRLGSNMPKWRAFWGMRLADANGDGLISEAELGELVKYAKKIGYTFHSYNN